MLASPVQTRRSAATSSTCSGLTRSSGWSGGCYRRVARSLTVIGRRTARHGDGWRYIGDGWTYIRALERSDIPPPRSRGLQVLLDLCPLALDVVETTAHEERLLGDVVVLAVGDLAERLDVLVQRHGRTLDPGELLCHVGVLGKEPLDATGPVD